MLTCFLKLNNGPKEFIENRECYKIHCFDQDDELIDIFSSHHHEIAKSFSRINYQTEDWKKFYESLKFIFEIERELHFSEIISGDITELQKRMFDELDETEYQLNTDNEANPINSESPILDDKINIFDE